MVRKSLPSIVCFFALGFGVFAGDRELWNGRDFEGWEFDVISSKVEASEIWSVMDGVIVCAGRPLSVMRTVDEFTNYELELEWQWADPSNPGNSGILVHASSPRHRSVWPKSIEIQLAHERAGDFWMIGESLHVEKRETLGPRIPRIGDSAERPPGEWNELKIRCAEDSIEVWVNGKLVNHAQQCTAVRGSICLQSEGAKIHFRKLRIRPIESVDAP